MSKGARTREQVVERAAALFNQLGYQGASLSDIMGATGLKKGGIYRHFSTKQQLELEAFDYSVQKMRERFTLALEGKVGVRARLMAVVDVYTTLPLTPPVAGGCPVLNAAVEADDAYPELRERAQHVMSELKRFLKRLLRDGIAQGELQGGLDLERTASTMIALLEGSVMLSKLYGNVQPMRHSAAHFDAWLTALERPRR
ncbi:MAG: TetR/AcrR family transcriptional regulator [Polyangiaceae bacterium]